MIQLRRREKPSFLPLAFSALLIAGALAVPVKEGQRKLPFTLIRCPYRMLTGKPCPLCGGTRSFIHAAHLHFKDSVELNPLGTIAFLLVAANIPYQLAKQLRYRWGRWDSNPGSPAPKAGVLTKLDHAPQEA